MSGSLMVKQTPLDYHLFRINMRRGQDGHAEACKASEVSSTLTRCSIPSPLGRSPGGLFFMSYMTFVCENCGKIVEFFYVGSEYTVVHFGCDEPKVGLLTHNPKLLGIVSSE